MSVATASPPPWQFEVFYDGACPLCTREIHLLMRLDRAGRIRFTDIAAEGFDASALGLDWATLMNTIHGRLPNGAIVEGVEVFRRLYDAVGFGPLVRASRAPGVSHLLDLGYSLFAKNRLKLTGRCESDACAAPARRPAVLARRQPWPAPTAGQAREAAARLIGSRLRRTKRGKASPSRTKRARAFLVALPGTRTDTCRPEALPVDAADPSTPRRHGSPR